jgi:hypothetical protein
MNTSQATHIRDVTAIIKIKRELYENVTDSSLHLLSECCGGVILKGTLLGEFVVVQTPLHSVEVSVGQQQESIDGDEFMNRSKDVIR